MTKIVAKSDQRKKDHIRINLEEDVQSRISNGFENYQFIHNPLPEISLSDVDLSANFLGKKLDAPLLISSMTGGTPEAQKINQILAEGAQRQNIAMGLGSLRALLESPDSLETFNVRNVAPDILLFANIGAVQLNYGVTADDCRWIVDSVNADALFLHLNPLQEALQPEGDTNFSGLLKKIETVCHSLDVPVFVKEVGWGISGVVAKSLVEAGVTGIDISGAGGTSWSEVEKYRISDPIDQEVAESFDNWGIPSATSLKMVRKNLPIIPLISSGGIRSGIDVAKSLALGADICGMAGPFLQGASQSLDELLRVINKIKKELKITMFSTGCSSLEELSSAKLIQSNS